MKETIREFLLSSGATAVGFAKAGKIDESVGKQYDAWIKEGCHGEMSYLERHSPFKEHTDHVLPEAATVISLAFGYSPERWRTPDLPLIAAYAYGEDYHIVIREKLFPIIRDLKAKYGGKWRLCIDSAPIAERYWAVKSGIGIRGINGSVISRDGNGFCFLAEILTTLEIEPDKPSADWCCKCGACIKECPSKAIRGDGTIDSRRCINYLTIEKKNELNQSELSIISSGKTGFLYGCDLCLRMCPHNKTSLTSSKSIFKADERIMNLTLEEILSMTTEEFKKRHPRSPILYAGFSKLRNIADILRERRREKENLSAE